MVSFPVKKLWKGGSKISFFLIKEFPVKEIYKNNKLLDIHWKAFAKIIEFKCREPTMEMYEFGAFVVEKCCQTFQIKKDV